MALAVAIWGLVSAILGWIANEQWKQIKMAHEKIDETKQALYFHREEVAKTYVPRVDYKADVNRLFDKLDEISRQLAEKADRPHGG